MKRAIPILILCALFLAGCHIAADKDEQGFLGPGATWTRVEGVALDSATVAIVTGKNAPEKPSGWITRIDHMKAGDTDKGVVSTNVKHTFGLDGIQTPLTRQPGVNAVVRKDERRAEVGPAGTESRDEGMKGLGVTELLWWIAGSALLIAAVLGAVYYYVPASRPIISGLISKLPGLGHAEATPKVKK